MFARIQSAVRLGAFAPLVLVLFSTTACTVEVVKPVYETEDSPSVHFGDGYLATMFGSTLVDIWAGGQVVGNPVVVAPGDPMVITSAFHDAGANMIMGLTEYDLVMTPAAPLVTFKRTGALTGTLARVAPGSTVLMVGLHNNERQLEDFGPFPVPLTVR